MPGSSLYTEIFKDLIADEYAIKLASSARDLDFIYVCEPDCDSPFAPAFLPMISDTVGTKTGYWFHPLTDRTPSIVAYHANVWDFPNDLVIEKAKSTKQLVKILILKILEFDQEATTRVIEFCQQWEIDHVPILESALTTGDCISSLFDDPDFVNNLPFLASFYSNSYSGDFPSKANRFNNLNCCLYELHDCFKDGVANFDSRYRFWLDSETPDHLVENVDLLPTFRKLLNGGCLIESWYLLNRSGWQVGEIRLCLKDLCFTADSKALNLLVGVWDSWAWDDDQVVV